MKTKGATDIPFLATFEVPEIWDVKFERALDFLLFAVNSDPRRQNDIVFYLVIS